MRFHVGRYGQPSGLSWTALVGSGGCGTATGWCGGRFSLGHSPAGVGARRAFRGLRSCAGGAAVCAATGTPMVTMMAATMIHLCRLDRLGMTVLLASIL